MLHVDYEGTHASTSTAFVLSYLLRTGGHNGQPFKTTLFGSCGSLSCFPRKNIFVDMGVFKTDKTFRLYSILLRKLFSISSSILLPSIQNLDWQLSQMRGTRFIG